MEAIAKKEESMDIQEYIDWPQIKQILSNIISFGWIKVILSVIATVFAWFFDDTRGANPALIVAALIVLDSISGIIAAIKSGEGLSSKKSKRVVWKFLIYGVAIITGRLIDKLIPVPAFAVIIEVFLGVTEGQSIIENLGRSGMPIPKKLENLFTVLKGADTERKK